MATSLKRWFPLLSNMERFSLFLFESVSCPLSDSIHGDKFTHMFHRNWHIRNCTKLGRPRIHRYLSMHILHQHLILSILFTDQSDKNYPEFFFHFEGPLLYNLVTKTRFQKFWEWLKSARSAKLALLDVLNILVSSRKFIWTQAATLDSPPVICGQNFSWYLEVVDNRKLAWVQLLTFNSKATEIRLHCRRRILEIGSFLRTNIVQSSENLSCA